MGGQGWTDFRAATGKTTNVLQIDTTNRYYYDRYSNVFNNYLKKDETCTVFSNEILLKLFFLEIIFKILGWVSALAVTFFIMFNEFKLFKAYIMVAKF